MESIEEQDDIQSHKNKNEYILPNYSQINYYPEKYITIPYENISNQNQFQAIKKIFHIDNRSNTIPDCNSISNQQIIIPEETSFNNAIHKTKEINENNLLINNSLNKETISENNNNANKFQTGRWSQTEHQKFIEGILKYLALGTEGIAGTARLMRSSILNVRKMEYMDAARMSNCSNPFIILKHVLPNTFAPILVQATMGVGARIMMAASMSYIGIGVQPPTPEWGAMLSDSRDFLMKYPYMCLIPGVAIMIVVLALNLLGDGLRDAMDPKLKK